MSLVPKKAVDKVQFYENHLAPWTSNAVAIGTSAAEVTALQARTEAARTAFNAQQAARQAAKTATGTFKNAVFAMGISGAGVLKQVRAKGESTGDPNVYTLAQIPSPAIPAPVGTPGTPTDIKVTLDGDGALHLKWKCKNPPGSYGTIYQLFRRVGAVGEFGYLGGSGEKKFVDTSVPMGATQITYQIQALRSTAAGMWASFNVNFGCNAGGDATATVTAESASATAPRLAA